MKHYTLTIVGTGYIGLVTGACFALMGHTVVCHDVDRAKISGLQKGKMPFYEPGLRTLVRGMVGKRRLRFTTDLEDAVQQSQVVFFTVGTPSRKDGSVDLRYVRQAAQDLAGYVRPGMIIVSKSTVPVGTSLLIRRILERGGAKKFAIVSNPEFLREAVAIDSFIHADRVVIGYEEHTPSRVRRIMNAVYSGLHVPIIETNNRSAELIKYAANVYLAGQISFINSIARLCEEIGADVEEIATALKADRRIGPRAFLQAGIGYGGLCFPKDIRALIKISKKMGYHFKYLDVVEEVNKDQRKIFVEKLRRMLGTLKGKHITLFGLSFKPNTDDMREAPSLDIIRLLLKAGAHVAVTDPKAIPYARRILGKSVTYISQPARAVVGADAIGIVTEWSDYRRLPWSTLIKKMKSPHILDGRNMLNPRTMASYGYLYEAMGRK